SDYHRACLTAGETARGWRRLFAKSENFLAILSANKNGLRFFVSLDNFAVFIPWSELKVSAQRSLPGTVVRLHIAALPSMNLEFHLNDEAADTLFSGNMAPLPRRDPPGRLYRPKPWALSILLGFMLTAAIIPALLKLDWLVIVAAVCILSVVLSLVWDV